MPTLKPVTDPALLQQLEAAPAQQAAPTPPQPKLRPVTDPALVAQLEGTPSGGPDYAALSQKYGYHPDFIKTQVEGSEFDKTLSKYSLGFLGAKPSWRYEQGALVSGFDNKEVLPQSAGFGAHAARTLGHAGSEMAHQAMVQAPLMLAGGPLASRAGQAISKVMPTGAPQMVTKALQGTAAGALEGGLAGGGEYLAQQVGVAEENPEMVALTAAAPLAVRGALAGGEAALHSIGRGANYIRGFSTQAQAEKADEAAKLRDMVGQEVAAARQARNDTALAATLANAQAKQQVQDVQTRGWKAIQDARAQAKGALEQKKASLAQAGLPEQQRVEQDVVKQLRSIPPKYAPKEPSQPLYEKWSKLPDEKIELEDLAAALKEVRPDIKALKDASVNKRYNALRKLLKMDGPNLQAAERELKLLGQMVRTVEQTGGMKKGVAKRLDAAFLADLGKAAQTQTGAATLKAARESFKREKGVERLTKSIEGKIRSKAAQELASPDRFLDDLRRNEKVYLRHFKKDEVDEMRTLAEQLARQPKEVQARILKEAETALAAERKLQNDTVRAVVGKARAEKDAAKRAADATKLVGQQQKLAVRERTAEEMRGAREAAKGLVPPGPKSKYALGAGPVLGAMTGVLTGFDSEVSAGENAKNMLWRAVAFGGGAGVGVQMLGTPAGRWAIQKALKAHAGPKAHRGAVLATEATLTAASDD